MTNSPLHTLPDAQLDPLRRAYAQAQMAKHLRLAIMAMVFCIAVLMSANVTEINLPKLWQRRAELLDYFDHLIHLDSGGYVWTDPAEWFWNLGTWSWYLLETIIMSYVGTLTGAIFGFCLCFLASSNITKNLWLRGLARRGMEVLRTVPDLVFALIFVEAFGLGPVAGVSAIAVHTSGALGKQFYELVENIDPKPLDGILAAGGSKFHAIRFAVLPQVLAGFASYAVLRFEINVREASILGYVGAGGIGFKLLEAIRKFYYTDVSAILVMLIVTVFVIEIGMSRLRAKFLIDTGVLG